MPINNSHIMSRLLPFKRFGYQLKSTKTESSMELNDNVDDTPSHRRGLFDSGRTLSTLGRSRTHSSSSKSSFTESLKSFEDLSSLSIKIESPPLVFYGHPKDSTGALLSGLITLYTPSDVDSTWQTLTIVLRAETQIKRPVCIGCSDCAKIIDIIHTWTFRAPMAGTFTPFSCLLPGHLPASTNNSLIRITYSLYATATSPTEEISYSHPITIERSILPGPDKHSVRMFPPTILKTTVTLPSVIYPGSDFLFDVTLDGVVNTIRNTRWKLRKIIWRIDEHTRAISPACKTHSAKLGGEGKGVSHEDIRTLGFNELRKGWKSDFDTADGRIEMEVHASIPASSKAATGMVTAAGAVVQHVLVLEMIVLEEHRPGPGKIVTPTGAARVLKMQVRLHVTGRSGLGIAWDMEMPPMYGDIPEPPPGYMVVKKMEVET
ncbi:hypothetical protein BZA77DRAFT_309597 [Pyronema omphalodes]|nr:hypothetical protein BZA77DRAFT_309597 [Pyronema omphalodes]